MWSQLQYESTPEGKKPKAITPKQNKTTTKKIRQAKSRLVSEGKVRNFHLEVCRTPSSLHTGLAPPRGCPAAAPGHHGVFGGTSAEVLVSRCGSYPRAGHCGREGSGTACFPGLLCALCWLSWEMWVCVTHSKPLNPGRLQEEGDLCPHFLLCSTEQGPRTPPTPQSPPTLSSQPLTRHQHCNKPLSSS